MLLTGMIISRMPSHAALMCCPSRHALSCHAVPPAQPCSSNPCANDANSNGTCTFIVRDIYSCACKPGYLWNGNTRVCEGVMTA